MPGLETAGLAETVTAFPTETTVRNHIAAFPLGLGWGRDPCEAPPQTPKASLLSVAATAGATGRVRTRPNSGEHRLATPCVTPGPASWL